MSGFEINIECGAPKPPTTAKRKEPLYANRPTDKACRGAPFFCGA